MAPIVTSSCYHCSKKKKLDYISRFAHIILAPVHASHPCAGAELILSVSSLYVALQSTVYPLLDKMVIDRANEAAIELTSAVGPVKGWFSDHSKKTNTHSKLYVSSLLRGHAVQKLDMFVTSLCQSHARSLSLSVQPKEKDKDTPVISV